MHKKNAKLPMLVLLMPMLLVGGCSTKPPSSLPSSVVPARMPPLSPEAKQPPAPPWCSPTCSKGLSTRIESWRKRMTEPE